MVEGEPRPEWNISKIPVGADVGGLIITVAIVAGALAGWAPARWFLALALPLGVVIAVILRLTARDRG